MKKRKSEKGDKINSLCQRSRRLKEKRRKILRLMMKMKKLMK